MTAAPTAKRTAARFAAQNLGSNFPYPRGKIFIIIFIDQRIKFQSNLFFHHKFMTYLTIILALIAVESTDNDNAIGDDGLAYGCLQMHAAYVQDAAEYAGEQWVHGDAFDRQTSIDIFLAYMARYATEARLGRVVTAEDIVRIHNGGPNGWKKESTKPHWNKVKSVLVNTQTQYKL